MESDLFKHYSELLAAITKCTMDEAKEELRNKGIIHFEEAIKAIEDRRNAQKLQAL